MTPPALPVHPPLAVIDAGRLQLLATDGIVPGEALAPLQAAGRLLAAARVEARRVVAEGIDRVAELRTQAEAEGREWLAARERELQAQLAVQQSQWLAELQPTWLAALERCLRQLCGEDLRAEVLAGALAAGLRHFESIAGLRLMVAPADLDHARYALARLEMAAAAALRVEADATLAPGDCRLRGAQLEVTLQLDRAIELALAGA